MMLPVTTSPVTMSLDTALVARLRQRASAEGMSLSALVNRELSSREALSYFAASERVYARESLDQDSLVDELFGDTA
jgi:predicted DNA-binding ribbon-helix-helix protein